MWTALQFPNGLASVAQTAPAGGVAYGAHMGGFIGGLVRPATGPPGGHPQPGGRYTLCLPVRE